MTILSQAHLLHIKWNHKKGFNVFHLPDFVNNWCKDILWRSVAGLVLVPHSRLQWWRRRLLLGRNETDTILWVVCALSHRQTGIGRTARRCTGWRLLTNMRLIIGVWNNHTLSVNGLFLWHLTNIFHSVYGHNRSRNDFWAHWNGWRRQRNVVRLCLRLNNWALTGKAVATTSWISFNIRFGLK